MAWALILFLHSTLAQQVMIVLPAAGEREIAAASHGCQRALGEGRCRVQSEPEISAPAASSPSALAASHRVRVQWDAERLEATLTFHGPDAADSRDVSVQARQRLLRFSADDPLQARYEAIGLVVAAYVVAWASAQGEPQPATESTLAIAFEQEHRPDAAVSLPPPFMAELAAGAGYGIQGGPARVVLALSAGRRLTSAVPALSGVAELQLATDFSEPEVSWTCGGLGAELELLRPVPNLSVLLRGVFALERFAVRAQAQGVEAAAQRFRYGGRARLSAQLCVVRELCAFMAVQAEALWPAVRLEVSGEAAGQQWIRGLSGLLGLRFRG